MVRVNVVEIDACEQPSIVLVAVPANNVWRETEHGWDEGE